MMDYLSSLAPVVVLNDVWGRVDLTLGLSSEKWDLPKRTIYLVLWGPLGF